jgi:hypothetical protein
VLKPLSALTRRPPGARQGHQNGSSLPEISRGELPSVRQIKARAKVGMPKAQEIRDGLTAILREAQPEAA